MVIFLGLKKFLRIIFRRILFLLFSNEIKDIELPMRIKSVLIPVYMGIGNFVMFTPVLRNLKKHFPEVKITVITFGNPAIEAVLNTNYVDELIYLNLLNCSYFTFLKYVLKFRNRKFDLILTNFNSFQKKVPLFCYILKSEYKISHRPFSKTFDYYSENISMMVELNLELHETDLDLKLIEPLGITNPSKLPIFGLISENYDFIKSFLEKNNINKRNSYFVVHPGSWHIMDWKRWSLEKYAILIDKIIDRFKISVVFAGNKNEIELIYRIAHLMRNYSYSIAGISTLQETAAAIKWSRFLLGNDSGLMHVGAAVGTPTITLFGPTDVRRVAPFGEKSIIVNKGLTCQPCYHLQDVSKVNACSHKHCLSLLTVEEVFKKIIENMVKLNLPAAAI